MSMIAHGYGVADYGSPYLLFSNVIWGYIVRGLPETAGILGYSWATLLVQFFVAAAIFYGLAELRLGFVGAIAALAIMLTRPTLFPQFTLNSGLLCVAAVLFWKLYAENRDRKLLVIGCLFAFFSSIVRIQEFIVVFIVAAPILLPVFLKSREAKVFFGLLGLAILTSLVIDHYAYSGPSWNAYNAFNLVRAAFTDFGALERGNFDQETLNRYQYTLNDLQLLRSFFFADPQIADPEKLTALLKGFFGASIELQSLAQISTELQILTHRYLLYPILSAVVVFIFFPSRAVSLSWVLFIAAILALGALGRPSIARVYFPIACLLIIAPITARDMGANIVSIWRRRALVAALCFLSVINFYSLANDAFAVQQITEKNASRLKNLPASLVVAWGAGFPFDAAYSVIQQRSASTPYRLYGLGVSTLAPFSVAAAEEAAGTGFKARLTSPAGLTIFSHEYAIDLLGAYCRERLKGSLMKISADNEENTAFRRMRCTP